MYRVIDTVSIDAMSTTRYHRATGHERRDSCKAVAYSGKYGRHGWGCDPLPRRREARANQLRRLRGLLSDAPQAIPIWCAALWHALRRPARVDAQDACRP